uniref:Protein kinase-like domain, phloem protein 2-like protein n=1 Tax=Tanacetum cinerariifolium TaxID=118510 RepID=A0A699I068_TANCI|nr:protein kinase-like domain, phloem protein 2-like protein [Tanacetum cinerariifolium]
MYVALIYKLEGEIETSIVYLANNTKDNGSFIAELYQFTRNRRTFDLDIVFEDHEVDLDVEGILFQSLEKVEHEQVLEDKELSNDSLQWTMKKDLFSYLLKRFHGEKILRLDVRNVVLPFVDLSDDYKATTRNALSIFFLDCCVTLAFLFLLEGNPEMLDSYFLLRSR